MNESISPITVNKIGGANMAQMAVVNQLVNKLHARQERVVLVVSAFEGVTNELYKAMDALSGTDYSEEDIDAAFLPVRAKHEEMIGKFFKTEYAYAPRAQAVYDAGFAILKAALMTHKAVSNILMPVTGSFDIRDQVIGFGENMAATLLNIYLEQKGKNSIFVDGVEADRETLEQGPVTDESLHEAKKKGIVRALRAAQDTRKNVIQIVGGHVARTPRGLVQHQNRGYTDITAVDAALALQDMGERVAAMRFWKDVDGIYTADPDDLEGDEYPHDPKLHEDVSNDEALESASAGSAIINGNAISLAGKHGLDLHIRNIDKLDPDHGTNIITGGVNTRYLFKTIVTYPHVDAITVTLPAMADKDGFAAAITKQFAEHEVSIDLIGTAGTSITFSVMLRKNKADQDADRMRIREVIRDLKVLEVKGERYTVQGVDWDQGAFANLSIIGRELENRHGILGSVATTLGAFGINIYAMSQGKKQTRMSFLIDQRHHVKALRLLHSLYVDNDQKVRAERDRRVAELDNELMSTFNGKEEKTSA